MRSERSAASRLSENVRLLREREGLSQAQLARLASVSRSQILAIERAERASTIASVDKVARALGVGPAELLRDRHAGSEAPDESDRLTLRLRALGTNARRAIEAVVGAMEALAQPRRRR
jgi:putative transcriptional regulator